MGIHATLNLFHLRHKAICGCIRDAIRVDRYGIPDKSHVLLIAYKGYTNMARLAGGSLNDVELIGVGKHMLNSIVFDDLSVM